MFRLSRVKKKKLKNIMAVIHAVDIKAIRLHKVKWCLLYIRVNDKYKL